MILPPFSFGGVRIGRGSGDVKVSPYMRCSHSIGSPSSTLAVAGYNLVRDEILKYKSCLTLAASVAALQCQVKLVSPKDSYKLVIQA